MRPIKFKAKVKKHSTLLDVLTIDFGNCIVCIVDSDRGNQETFDWSEVENLYQFTGLPDEKVCEWTQTNKYTISTGCGHAIHVWYPRDMAPYCPFCGKKIKEVGDES